ncbi:coiled-coil domain-containing protein 137-like [Apostichopus japonicus]|uniref:coiled-coil domain-containing protein 137-like n=1 Tax=Stichopus japonicus TaxID=307972 RepID=UPI003AB1A754
MGKHKRIKAIDPFLTGPRRDKRVREQKRWEEKQDVAPINPGEQSAPNSFKSMLGTIEDAKKTKAEKKREKAEKRKVEIAALEEVGIKPVTYPEEGEKMDAFVQRVSSSANKKIREERMKILVNSHDENSDRKTKVSDSNKRRLALLKKKAEHKKIEKNLDQLEKDFFTEKIAFGDVARCPPQFTAKPRGGKATEKSGKKQLHLSAMLSKNATAPVKHQESSSSKYKKRKAMTLYERKAFDEKQSAAIEAYRKVKMQRMSGGGNRR